MARSVISSGPDGEHSTSGHILSSSNLAHKLLTGYLNIMLMSLNMHTDDTKELRWLYNGSIYCKYYSIHDHVMMYDISMYAFHRILDKLISFSFYRIYCCEKGYCYKNS